VYPGPTKRTQIAWIVAVLVVAVAFVCAQLVRAGEPLGLDQGLFACFGRWLRDGWLPYRDIFDSKPPLHLYTWVLAWACGTWWFEAFWLAATMGVAALAVRRWNSAPAGLAAAVLVFAGLWAPGLGGYWSRLQAEELLALPVLGAAWLALAAVDRPRLAFACGVLAGAAGLYKVPALITAVAWPVLWRERRRTAWFAAGAASPWLAAALWFAAHGALADFTDAVFFYQRHWIAMIDPPWSDVVHGFVAISLPALAPLWVAAAAGIALLWRRDRARAACLATWIASAAVAVALQRQLAGYHFLLLVPPLAFAGGIGVAELAAHRRARYALVAIAVLLGVAARDWTKAYGGHSWQLDQYVPAAQQEIARYIAAHTKPGDGILVWALAPAIYPLADRHPTTRFPFHRLLLTDSPLALHVPGRDARRAAFLARLAADPPAMIVVGLHDANPFEPQDSGASLVAFHELGAIVQRDYKEVMRDDHFVVLARTAAR
jgi:hypothetical protein